MLLHKCLYCQSCWYCVFEVQVQGDRGRPKVARSLDLSSSPLSSLKAIVNDMSRPQSASLPKRSNSVNTSRSCKKPSTVPPPARKLNNPEFHSSAWLLSKMEALRNETFTEPKALQVCLAINMILPFETYSFMKWMFMWAEHSTWFMLRNVL